MTNGQRHIGGWVENVTNGQTDERTVKMGTDGRTHGRTESCFLKKACDSKQAIVVLIVVNRLMIK